MAVYTHMTADEASIFISQQYNIGDFVSIQDIISGIENSNFLVHTDVNRFILTIYERRVDKNDLPFFLGFMEHLAEHGVPCPLPIHNADGELVSELKGKPATIISFLNGKSVGRITPIHCAELGKNLARIHIAGEGFDMEKQNAFSITDWDDLFLKIKDKVDNIAPNLMDLIERELDFLNKNWDMNLPTGIIHGDLFPDNVLFSDDKLSGIIDFAFACNDYLAYDIAICLNAWCFENDESFNVTKSMAFLKGYNDVRQLTNEEKTALPILARGASMRFLLSRCYDWLNPVDGAISIPKNPLEYYQKLKFHQCVKGAGDYGIY